MIWNIIGIIAASLTMFGFVPQCIKIWENKSVEDVSVITLFQFSIGVTLWMLYGIHLRDYIIILANAVSLTTLIIALFLYFRFKSK